MNRTQVRERAEEAARLRQRVQTHLLATRGEKYEKWVQGLEAGRSFLRGGSFVLRQPFFARAAFGVAIRGNSEILSPSISDRPASVNPRNPIRSVRNSLMTAPIDSGSLFCLPREVPCGVGRSSDTHYIAAVHPFELRKNLQLDADSDNIRMLCQVQEHIRQLAVHVCLDHLGFLHLLNIVKYDRYLKGHLSISIFTKIVFPI